MEIVYENRDQVVDHFAPIREVRGHFSLYHAVNVVVVAGLTVVLCHDLHPRRATSPRVDRQQPRLDGPIRLVEAYHTLASPCY